MILRSEPGTVIKNDHSGLFYRMFIYDSNHNTAKIFL